jgi:hypothetical protein
MSVPSRWDRADHVKQHADPAQIPHDVEERWATTLTNPEPKEQVKRRFQQVLQISDVVRTTLSRWRHGFEPRWDYKGQCRAAAHHRRDQGGRDHLRLRLIGRAA